VHAHQSLLQESERWHAVEEVARQSDEVLVLRAAFEDALLAWSQAEIVQVFEVREAGGPVGDDVDACVRQYPW